MAGDRHIYGEVNSKSDMRKVFTNIRRDIESAQSRPALTELYKRAGYLITLTHARSWQEKFGRDAASLREVGEEEFRKQSGCEVHGVRIEYEQSRRPYRRGAYTATRGQTEAEVPETNVAATIQRFAQVVELPREARNIQFHAAAKDLPEPYRHARQRVR
jgi:hypothetical protein